MAADNCVIFLLLLLLSLTKSRRWLSWWDISLSIASSEKISNANKEMHRSGQRLDLDLFFIYSQDKSLREVILQVN